MDQVQIKEQFINSLKNSLKELQEQINRNIQHSNSLSNEKITKQSEIFEIKKTIQQSIEENYLLTQRLSRLQIQFEQLTQLNQILTKNFDEEKKSLETQKQNFCEKMLDLSIDNQIQSHLDKLKPKYNEAATLKEKIDDLFKSNENVTTHTLLLNPGEPIVWPKKEDPSQPSSSKKNVSSQIGHSTKDPNDSEFKFY